VTPAPDPIPLNPLAGWDEDFHRAREKHLREVAGHVVPTFILDGSAREAARMLTEAGLLQFLSAEDGVYTIRVGRLVRQMEPRMFLAYAQGLLDAGACDHDLH
jgi:hypothetical protein